MLTESAQARREAPATAPAAPLSLFDFVRRLAGDLANDLELPGFPDVVARLHQALGDERTDARVLVRLVSAEPALGARLVQLANSAAFNAAGRPVSDLRSAITLLGFNVLRSTATTFAMRQLEQQAWLEPVRPHLTRIWNDSTGVAAIAYVASRRIAGMRPDEALAAGLFHQLGGLYVLTSAHREGIALGADGDWVETVASWQPAIGRAILETWRSPGHLCEAVEQQDSLAGEDPATMPLLTRLLGVAKLQHAARHGRLDDAGAAQAAAVKFGTTPFGEILKDCEGEIEKVRAVISGN
jgi:HD-like signal output (HDOD) protein